MEVRADRATTVNESEKTNITLFCKVKAGNPTNLITVRWYVNNQLMYEYPNASNLILENVQREHHGNYSCQGLTEAGFGFTSAPVEVFVQCKYSKLMNQKKRGVSTPASLLFHFKRAWASYANKSKKVNNDVY